MSKKILFIQFPKSFVYTFENYLPKKDLSGVFISFQDITQIGGDLLYEQNLIQDFDFICIGLTMKNREFYLLLVEYLNFHQTPHIVYGAKDAGTRKFFEIFRLSQNKIPIIPSVVSNNKKTIQDFVNKYGFPLVSKPVNGAKGRDVVEHKSLDSLMQSLQTSEISLIIQPKIPNNGDYRVWILKDKILGVIKRSSKNTSEFRNNISLGGKAEVSDLPKSVLDLCIRAKNIMNLDISGVDVIQDLETGKYYILEVNYGPQYKGFLEATNINPLEKIVDYIENIIAF